MRPDGIVMTAPALDDDLRLAESVEDLAVEQLVPEPLSKHSCSFDHLVGPAKEGGRNFEADGLRCCDIDHQLELGRLRNRQRGRIGTLENSVHVLGRITELISQIRAIGKEATHFYILPPPEGRRQPRLASEVRDCLALAEEHRIRQQNDPFDARSGRGSKSGLQIGWDAGLDQVEGSPIERAALSVSWSCKAEDGLLGLRSTARRSTLGTASRRTSRSLPLRSRERLLTPVTLPPGRAKLATTPDPTGSATPTMMIGSVDVARRAAVTAGVPQARIRSTLSRGSAVESSASSGSPCGQGNSSVMFCSSR